MPKSKTQSCWTYLLYHLPSLGTVPLASTLLPFLYLTLPLHDTMHQLRSDNNIFVVVAVVGVVVAVAAVVIVDVVVVVGITSSF